jgi:hypothetical protein
VFRARNGINLTAPPGLSETTSRLAVFSTEYPLDPDHNLLKIWQHIIEEIIKIDLTTSVNDILI